MTATRPAPAAKFRRLLDTLNATEAHIDGLYAMLALAKQHNMGCHVDRLTAEIAEFEEDRDTQMVTLAGLGYRPQ